ncbi:MAG: hypothetical protein AAF667_03345 [Pseudomonadota bacterium]
MLAELKTIVARSAPTLLADTLGAAALVVMLLVALHAPGVI